MGHGTYSSVTRTARAETLGFTTNSIQENFPSRSINNGMNPHGIELRESRDNEEHPNSVPIILGLDVTASMGSVPQQLIQNGLPKLISGVIQGGIPDPQLLFLAIGDHECDQSPLQVAQFESSDELLDQWLTDVYLEGGGGGNGGESYLLAWYFAARHTATDSFEKRGKKGFLFTIGDEPTLPFITGSTLKGIMGEGQYGDLTASELLEEARKTYNVFHIHVRATRTGRRKETADGWKELMQEDLLIADSPDEISALITDKIMSYVEESPLEAPTSDNNSTTPEVIL